LKRASETDLKGGIDYFPKPVPGDLSALYVKPRINNSLRAQSARQARTAISMVDSKP
jgi:hypothetical protein